MWTSLPVIVMAAALAAGTEAFPRPNAAPNPAPDPGIGAEATAPPVGFEAPVRGTPSGSAQSQPLQGYRWVESGGLRVAFRGRDSLRAAQVLALLEGFPTLPALPDTLPTGVTVFLAPTVEAFDSLTGGRVPEWGAGVAVPSLGRIVMPGFGTRRSRGWDELRVLKHEWAHLGLHQYLQGLRVPRWFDEGYAEWASGGWSPASGWRLRVSIALGRAPPLDSLALDWPRDRNSAELAYLLSATAVEYIIGESGERGLQIFLERWREDRNFDRALRSVYGVTEAQFEEDWRGYVGKRYGWLFVLSHSSVFWLSLTLLLLVMVRIRRGRDREGMARLRATEPPDQPAYWEQGPETDASPSEADANSSETNKDG